jgi:hypothetical protein
MPKSKETEEAPAEAGDILLKWTGPEHVREVRRADLGEYPESETVLTWDASNNFVCSMGLTEDEVQVLARSGGAWAIVEESSAESEEEEEPKIELPTVVETQVQNLQNQGEQVDATDESASDQA